MLGVLACTKAVEATRSPKRPARSVLHKERWHRQQQPGKSRIRDVLSSIHFPGTACYCKNTRHRPSSSTCSLPRLSTTLVRVRLARRIHTVCALGPAHASDMSGHLATPSRRAPRRSAARSARRTSAPRAHIALRARGLDGWHLGVHELLGARV